MQILRKIVSAMFIFLTFMTVNGAEAIDSVSYSASFMTNFSSGQYAPYMIGSWNGDRSTMKNSAIADFCAEKSMSTSRRFDWGAGIEFLAGYQHPASYEMFDAETYTWIARKMRPAPVSLRTLYAELHYRSIHVLAGMKPQRSKIVDDRLSSGDLVRSNNARPIPGLSVGFVDFQDIPFTNGWLQVDCQIMYGKFMDDDYRRKQFNYYNQLVATDLYYTYKYCLFRTKPTERLSVIFGMQAAGQFGGTTEFYYRGHLRYAEHRGFRVKDVIKMLVPTLDNGNGYYEGNSLGAWSLRGRYRFANDNEISVYWEKFFEDGSGIGCRNGMDGLYGVQLSFARRGWLNSVVAEYLDFRNQSGPLHFAPGDHIGPSISTEATGGDNYYNNDTYGSYVNYGMAIGSPMVMAPIYNSNGYPEFIFNRMRGVHVAVAGSPTGEISYKLMAGWQKGYAMGRIPLPHAKSDVSAMMEIDWNASRLCDGLSVDCRVAVDRGGLRGDNLGAALTVRYSGSINYKK